MSQAVGLAHIPKVAYRAAATSMTKATPATRFVWNRSVIPLDLVKRHIRTMGSSHDCAEAQPQALVSDDELPSLVIDGIPRASFI